MKPVRPVITADDERLAARCAKGRVVVIDDDPEILQALGTLLDLLGYAGELYADASGYLQALEADLPRFAGPVCVLCDVKLPELDGLELQRRLSRISDTPMVIMSGRSGALEASAAFRHGAQDFLVKPFDTDTLLAALDSALAVSQERQRRRLHQQALQARLAQLSARELAVALRVAQGQTNPAIAQALGIALRTVKLHRQHALEKLGVAHVADLVRLVDELQRAERSKSPGTSP